MAMPVLQDESGQELYTRDHGTVKVAEKSWMDGGFHIVLCPNGAYQHSNGLPVSSEAELHAAFGSNQEDLRKALDWFGHRHEQEVNPPRAIGFHPHGYPVFADGSIPEEADLYNFFSPGPVLSAAIIGLHDYRKRQETGAAPPALRKPPPPPPQVAQPTPAAAPEPDKPGPRAASANKRKSSSRKKGGLKNLPKAKAAPAQPAATG